MGSVNALLNLYCEQGKWRELTTLYHSIRKQGFNPNSFTFSSLLNFPSISPTFPPHQGDPIHADALKRGFVDSDSYVINALISMYARCGALVNACKVFDELTVPSVVNWNTMISVLFRAGDFDGARQAFDRMRKRECPNDVTWSAVISGCVQNDLAEESLIVFKKMLGECDETGSCLLPNSHTIASVFLACVKLRSIGFGRQVHGYTMKMSVFVESDVFVGSNLMDLYGKCHQVELAKLVFDFMVEKCVVAWSVLISTYTRNECYSSVIEAFREMVDRGVEPNYVTLSTLLTACADMPSLVLGKELHCFIVRRMALKPDVFVSTSLIDMYGKCRCMDYAYRIFERDKDALECCSSVSMYNAALSALIENNFLHDAWGVFRSMNEDFNAKPNSVTLATVLPLCTRSSLPLYGKEIHCYALKCGLEDELLVGNSLLDMYSKSGELQMAKNQFKLMRRRNKISWTSMIDAYGMHGKGEGAIKVFESMVTESDIKPDHVTFVALISACSHSGIVEEGLKYFEAMEKEYGVTPMEENYGSAVDLLARAGRLDEAKQLIATMPIKPGASVWGALLGACKIQGDAEEAEIALEKLMKLEPDESGFWKLLSSIYSEAGRLDSVAEIRKAIAGRSAPRRQGLSWL
ncbi:hypothetical protein Scep_011144 [Stephania cephalantha]|uniref:Pentatricopeptide repeat-containing protein n=1 Tax=Stephania cephalantha TaxID=152367 RepID=A0AAP0JCJ5_9MAGN